MFPRMHTHSIFVALAVFVALIWITMSGIQDSHEVRSSINRAPIAQK